MQIKIFTIPIGMEESRLDELNLFLRANKVVDVRKEIVTNGNGGCWTFCITYLEGVKPQGFADGKRGDKIDYREVLSSDEFKRFSDFRKIRKQLAEQEAVPAYAVFTDAELAEMAKLEYVTREQLKNISGIGKKRIEKYGDAFCINIDTMAYEEGRALEGTDN